MPNLKTTTSPKTQDSATPSTPLSFEALLTGAPERVVSSDEPIVTVTWLHNNEHHAPAVAHAVYTSRPDLAPHVNYICGNPHTAATAPELGFTYSDLNRSFSAALLAQPETYEEHRAVAVRDFVQPSRYILDLHNTVCTNFGKVIIIKASYLHEPAIRDIIAASPIKRILLMDSTVADHCLIGEAGARVVTFEYELGLTHTEAVPDMLQTIEALVQGTRNREPSEREVFRMVGTIPKTEDPGLHVKNFEPFATRDGKTHYAMFLGTGPRSYREDATKDYCGYYGTMERMTL